MRRRLTVATERHYWTAKAFVTRPGPSQGAPTKRHWHRIGSASGDPETDIIEVVVDVTPLDWDGRLTLFPVEPGEAKE